jgi:hypothetical protein
MQSARLKPIVLAAGLLACATSGLGNDDCVHRLNPSAPGCTDKCGVCPTHRCCQQQCGCDAPCRPPVVPREAAPPEEQPEIPGVPRQAFAVPQAGGEVEAPSRSVEWGGLTLTFPELSIGLPRLRFHGLTQTHRAASLRTDSMRAPLVDNPYYQQALLARAAAAPDTQTRESQRDEELEPPKPTTRSAEQCSQSAVSRGGSAELLERLRRLESEIRQLQQCLGDLESVPGERQAPTPPAEIGLRPLPQVNVEALSPASYFAPIWPSASRELRRLPPVDRR